MVVVVHHFKCHAVFCDGASEFVTYPERRAEQLEHVHVEIDACYVCRESGLGITKATGIHRGDDRARVMAIGIAPSQSARVHRQAFAGTSISRLRSWFREAGFDFSESELRDKIYLTSLIKCSAQPDTLGQRLALWRNCSRFLWAQVEILHPALILMLGGEPLNVVTDGHVGPISRVAGQMWTSLELFGPELIPRAPEETFWLALPHPSGLSRLMNNQEIHARVVQSLQSSLNAIRF